MSRATHLKIKIATLAAEARIIRRDERKALGHGRQGLKVGINPDFISRHYRDFNDLRDHRIGIVRSVTRTNLLAYGFLKGRSYAELEVKTNSVPDFKAVRKNAQTFSDGPWDEVRWTGWLKEARAHLHGQDTIQAWQLPQVAA